MNTKLLLVAVAAAAMTACGGGSDSASPAPSGPSASSTTTIAGTAAVGAALANATVQVKCASGSGTATTKIDGTFTVSIENAVRPCVLSVDTPDGALHSVVEAGNGTTAVANITPLTELVTASLAGGDTNAFFESFDVSAQSKLNAEGISGAVDSVRLILSGTVDLTGTDPLKDTLIAAHGDTPGNGLDGKLDTLGAALANSQTSLTDLSSAVGTGGGSTGGAQALLQPTAARCATFRSGKYQKVGLLNGVIQRYTLDAVGLAQTNDATGATETFTANAEEDCRFGTSDFRLTISKSGIGFERREGAHSLVIPEQTVALGELAGEWTALAYERESAGAPLSVGFIKFTLDGSGHFTASKNCEFASGCGDPWKASELPAISVNSANGGFNVADSEGTARAFAFKGIDGQLAFAMVHSDGFWIASRPLPRSLPAVGTVTRFWDATLDPTGAVSIATKLMTVTNVDTATGIITRDRGDGTSDMFRNNYPFDGLRYREGIAGPGGISEAVSMPVANTGISVVIARNATQSFYGISIDRP